MKFVLEVPRFVVGAEAAPSGSFPNGVSKDYLVHLVWICTHWPSGFHDDNGDTRQEGEF